jgi:hypothetical protein
MKTTKFLGFLNQDDNKGKFKTKFRSQNKKKNKKNDKIRLWHENIPKIQHDFIKRKKQ